MKSIITNDLKHCYVCGTNQNIELHHCIHGTAKRKLADKEGLIVPLCHEHHQGTKGVHGRDGHNLDKELKINAEVVWCEKNAKTPDDFIRIFGRNYLE